MKVPQIAAAASQIADLLLCTAADCRANQRQSVMLKAWLGLKARALGALSPGGHAYITCACATRSLHK